jgi:hypothetical protein
MSKEKQDWKLSLLCPNCRAPVVFESTSALQMNHLYGDILLEYSKYLQEHGYLDTDWYVEAEGENTVEDFINSKSK